MQRIHRGALWLTIGAAAVAAEGGPAAGEAPGDRGDGGRHPAAEKVSVRWEVLSNRAEGGERSRQELTLVNRGDVPLRGEGWTLYFNFHRRIDPETLPPEVRLRRVNGGFYELRPAPGFAALDAGERRSITYEAGGAAIKESDAPAGFYFVFEGSGGRPEAPSTVGDVTAAPFTRPRQTDRGPEDAVPVPTPASRYRDNRALERLPPGEVGRIVPTPARAEAGEGTFRLGSSTPIRHGDGLAGEASLLADALEPLLGARPPVEAAGAGGGPAVVLRTGRVTVAGEPADGEEAYRLTVDPEEGVEIVGSGAAGAFYGIQSLRSLVPLEAYRRPRPPVPLRAARVADRPRFEYRGLHLDVARNFQQPADVKRLLDVMALYKLNVLHLHLTDDEGWRLAIDGLPELTRVGGRRGHTLDEREHLIPSFGSGPDPDPAASHGSGWYTASEYRELLRYARDRHIQVVPEIDVPGHARAAIRAMESRHRRLRAEGRSQAASRYRLVHPDDESRYESVQGWDDNVIDACLPSTYRFLEKVFDEIRELHREADAPLRSLHVGGDEVPDGAWERSPACAELLDRRDDLRETADLRPHFLRQVERALADRDLVTAGWGEVALREAGADGERARVPDPEFAGRDVRAYVWSDVWGSGSAENAYRLANAGYEVVMAQASSLYFDLAYNKHPREAGLYWAGFVGTRDPYAFAPMELCRSAETDPMGHPVDPDEECQGVRLTAEGRRNVLGLQGHLWSETLHGPDRMEYMAVPRLMSLAERAWAPRPDWAGLEDRARRERELAAGWNEFANRLGQRELPRLSLLDEEWDYRLPVPGAVVEDGVLRANAALPGLTIRYTTDGSTPGPGSARYSGPVDVTGDGPVKLRAFAPGRRGSRTATVEP